MKKFICGMVLALFIGMGNLLPSISEAMYYQPSAYWCDNYNYPEVYYKGDVHYYVDLSSAFIKDQVKNSAEQRSVVCYNMVIVNPSGASTQTRYVLIVTAEDGYDMYNWSDSDGKWILNTGEFGYQMASFNAGSILMKHFGL